VGRFTSAIFAGLAQRTKYVDPALASAWERIAGPELASLCRPGRLTGGRIGRTLEVVAPDGAAAARVQFEAEALRRRANDWLGPNAVGRVLVRQAGARQAHDRLGAILQRFRASVGAKKSGYPPRE
jgi:hypothetical protein